MTGPVPAIALAVLGAVCFAGAAVLQHRAVGAVAVATPGAGLRLRGLRALAGRPGWLAGLALAGTGAGLHVVALVLAPISVVQPVGVLAVPFAVLLAVCRTRRRPAPAVVAAVALTVGGVATFVGFAAGSSVSAPVPNGATAWAAGVSAGIVAALAVVGAVRTGWVRCVACATAGAVAFGLVSALLRALSQQIAAGSAGAWDPTVAATAAAIVTALMVGGWLVQQGFAAGPPEVVVACLTVVDPIVAVVLGFVLLGEGTAGAPVPLMLACAAAAAGGVVALARHHPDAAGRLPAPTPVSTASARPENQPAR